MRKVLFVFAACVGLQSRVANAEPTVAISECGEGPLLGFVPADSEVAAHRQFQLPDLLYPYGIKRENWGTNLTLKIDATGKPVCFVAKSSWDVNVPLDDDRRAALAIVKDWRYEPFSENGKPVVAIVTEHVAEREAVERHVPLPDVPLGQVHFMLSRSGCFGTCPSYKVDAYGDGRAIYAGDGFVDVVGKHEYRIPPENVHKLLESLKEKDIWSLRSSYEAGVTDNPTFEIVIELGGQTRHIVDYVGQMAGMPRAISEFEDEIDEAASSKCWTNLGMEAVENLVSEGFPFKSSQGADLLARALANEGGTDDAAITRLLDLGAPISGGDTPSGPFLRDSGSALESALRMGRVGPIGPLVARGALQTNGVLDRRKLDSAFRAAIQGGKLEAVQAIWQAGGDVRPALDFEDQYEKRHAKASVITLLSHNSYSREEWDGLAIAKWLALQGCDLKAKRASGDSLLHIATDAGDVDFVRYLLSEGLKASELGEYGLSALGSATDESIAMMLLEAGADPDDSEGDGFDYRRFAVERHWQRVVAWLDSNRRHH